MNFQSFEKQRKGINMVQQFKGVKKMSTYITRVLIVSILLLFVGFGSPTQLFAGACPEGFEILCEGEAVANCRTDYVDIVDDEGVTCKYRIVDSYCALPNGNRQGFSEITMQKLDGKLDPAIYHLRGNYFNDMRVGKWDLFDAAGDFMGNCFYVAGKLNVKKSCKECNEFELELEFEDE